MKLFINLSLFFGIKSLCLTPMYIPLSALLSSIMSVVLFWSLENGRTLWRCLCQIFFIDPFTLLLSLSAVEDINYYLEHFNAIFRYRLECFVIIDWSNTIWLQLYFVTLFSGLFVVIENRWLIFDNLVH